MLRRHNNALAADRKRPRPLKSGVRTFHMRMKHKATLFYWSYLMIMLVLMLSGVPGLFIISIFLLFGISQFLIFRCPSCGLLAIKTHSGLYVPWVGNKCKFCDKDY